VPALVQADELVVVVADAEALPSTLGLGGLDEQEFWRPVAAVAVDEDLRDPGHVQAVVRLQMCSVISSGPVHTWPNTWSSPSGAQIVDHVSNFRWSRYTQ